MGEVTQQHKKLQYLWNGAR